MLKIPYYVYTRSYDGVSPRPSSLFPIICHHIPPAALARPDTMHSVLLPKPLWTLLIVTLFSATLFTFLTHSPLVSWRSVDVSSEGGAERRARSILSLSAVISANELMTAQYSHYTPCKGGTLCNVLPCTHHPPMQGYLLAQFFSIMSTFFARMFSNRNIMSLHSCRTCTMHAYHSIA